VTPGTAQVAGGGHRVLEPPAQQDHEVVGEVGVGPLAAVAPPQRERSFVQLVAVIGPSGPGVEHALQGAGAGGAALVVDGADEAVHGVLGGAFSGADRVGAWGAGRSCGFGACAKAPSA